MKVYFLLLLCVFQYSSGQTIAGGQPASINEYPYAASLLYNRTGTFEQACGGIVLTPTSLLSAASCFYTDNVIHRPEEWQATVGSSYAASGDVHLIRLITVHPDFQLTTMDNNIAILRTISTIELIPGVVEVAHIAGGAFTIAPRTRIGAIGWGVAEDTNSTGYLHHVSTFVVEQDICEVRYADLDFSVTNNMICVGWLDVGVHGQCSEGGAGSPIVFNGGIVGIHSWTEGCATLRYPSLNTRLSPYWRWIVAVANENLTPSESS
ncbi:trypsin, alkaline A [Aphomia sociella]